MAKVKVMAGMVFERQEKKYMILPSQFLALMKELENYMEYDEYGLHTISSIYYDTENFDLIRHSLDKPKFKEKLRLRCYGTPSKADIVYLELKKKLNGITHKRRIAIPLGSALDYLNHGIIPPDTEGQIFEEIDWFIGRWKVAAKMMLSYERLALFGKEDPNLRITIDKDVRWRDFRLDPSQGNDGELLIPRGYRLMEIKTMDALPIWLCTILSDLQIYPQSFSKSGTVYTQHLMNNYKEENQYVG